MAWDPHLTLAPTCSPGPHVPSLQDNFCLPWRCQVSDKDSGLFPLQLCICSGSSLEMLPFQAPRRVLGVETNLNTFAGMSAGGPERAVCTSVYVSIGPGASPIARSSKQLRDLQGRVGRALLSHFEILSASYKYLWEPGPPLTPPVPHFTRYMVLVCK